MEHEPTSMDVVDCGEAVKIHALSEFLSRSTSMDTFLRSWLGERFPRCKTTRIEMETAVRAYLGDLEWSPPERSRRPAVRSLESASPIK